MINYNDKNIEERKSKEDSKIFTGKTKVLLNIRENPNGKIVRTEKEGTILEYTTIKDGWAHLTDGNYCMEEYLEK